MRDPEDLRPDPETLLRIAQRQERASSRGRLRVYLGAAPGVGKTYAMLQEGQRRRKRGTDVVVGFVETHGRPLTAEALEGLEVVPRKSIVYQGVTLEEMDPERVIARRPQVVLGEELAHRILGCWIPLIGGRAQHPRQLPAGAPARDAFVRWADKMAEGGIYDHLGGGFARYSVDERWAVPHPPMGA